MVCPRVAAGMARGSTVRGPGGRGGSSFLPGSGCGCGYENPEANTVTCGFPVTVPCAGDGRLVLAERGLRRAPPGQVRLPDRFRRCGLMIEESGDHGAGLGYFLPAAAGQDRGDQCMTGKIAIKADDAAGEQVWAAARQPPEQRLLPGPRTAEDGAEHGPVLRRVREVHQHPRPPRTPPSRPAAPPTARRR